MMKKILSLSALLMCSVLSFAFEVGGIAYNVTSEENLTVEVAKKSYSGVIAIPDKVTYGGKEYSVTSIGDRAFEDCLGLTSVSIPNTVTTIGDKAFIGSSHLTPVTIPNSVTYIGSQAFRHCYDFTSVTIPNSVTYIGSGAFDSSGLTSVNIPKSVTTIRGNAFTSIHLTSITVESGNPNYDSRDNCNAIIETASNTLITGCYNTIIPTSVTSIGSHAFKDCRRLTSITIPNSVTRIGIYAFWQCLNLTSVTIPKSVTSIGDCAFENCRNLTSVTIPNSVTRIGTKAFSDCVALTSVSISNSITYIGQSVFEGCRSLTSVTIPNSVTEIGYFAFAGCRSLTSVTIPNSVTDIAPKVFSGCGSLASVTSLIKEPFEIDESVFTFNVNNESHFSTATLYVPRGCKKKYETASAWNKFKNIVEMNIAPVNDGKNVDFNTEIDEGTNLDGNIVGDILFSISRGNGGYNAAEGCLVVTKPTNDSDIDGKDIFGEDFKAGFSGVVFMVAPGKGSIKVEAETQGAMVLKVKIGDSDPKEMELDGKLKVSFPYNVSEDTYVYIYGGMNSNNAMGMRKAAGADALKIYGIEVTSGTDGIETIDNGQLTIDNSPIYNLNGQRVISSPSGRPGGIPTKGIYIKNGKKVLVK